MLQMRQQAPFSPMGQGFIVSARLNAVSMPQSSACASISRAAGSMLLAIAGFGSARRLRCFTSSMGELLHPRARARVARKPSAGAWTGQSGGGLVCRGRVNGQYLRWSPDMARSAGSVVVMRTPAVFQAGLSVGGASSAPAAPVA